MSTEGETLRARCLLYGAEAEARWEGRYRRHARQAARPERQRNVAKWSPPGTVWPTARTPRRALARGSATGKSRASRRATRGSWVGERLPRADRLPGADQTDRQQAFGENDPFPFRDEVAPPRSPRARFCSNGFGRFAPRSSRNEKRSYKHPGQRSLAAAYPTSNQQHCRNSLVWSASFLQPQNVPAKFRSPPRFRSLPPASLS